MCIYTYMCCYYCMNRIPNIVRFRIYLGCFFGTVDKIWQQKTKIHHKQQRVCCLSPKKHIVSQEQMKTNQQDIIHFSWNTCFHRNLSKRIEYCIDVYRIPIPIEFGSRISDTSKGFPYLQCVSTMFGMVITWDTLWETNIFIENGPFIVDLPIKNGDFP